MNKKFIFALVSIIFTSCMLFTSCKTEETDNWIQFHHIYFSPETLSMEAGETYDVSLIAIYTDASEVNITDSVTITCSDQSIVKYENGKVTALKDGEVTLSASYKGKDAVCEIESSSIEEIELSVNDADDDLLLIPGEIISGEDVIVTAYYTGGGARIVDATITSADPEILSIKKSKDGVITELQAVKSEGEQTYLTASYTTIAGTELKAKLNVYTGELYKAVITLGATKLDDKGNPKYQRDTLLLGDQSDVLVDGYFSYDVFGISDKRVVDARSFVDHFSFDEQILYVDPTKYTVDAIGLTPTPNDNAITAQLLGGSHSVSSRCIDVVSDPDYTLDPVNPYKVHTDAEYAYDNDIVYFKFTSEYVSKDGKSTKTVDLTNTGNTDITSGYYISEPKTTFCDASLIKLCTGKLQLSEQVSIHTIGVNNEDSTGVFVIYKTSSKIDTVYSNQFRLYTHPQLTYSDWSRGKVGENIVINWFANHLWLDEVEIVDNFGNRYTKDDIKTISHYSAPTQIYVLPLKNPDMYNKTYTFTYGPEKRQCILTVGAAPQN